MFARNRKKREREREEDEKWSKILGNHNIEH